MSGRLMNSKQTPFTIQLALFLKIQYFLRSVAPQKIGHLPSNKVLVQLDWDDLFFPGLGFSVMDGKKVRGVLVYIANHHGLIKPVMRDTPIRHPR